MALSKKDAMSKFEGPLTKDELDIVKRLESFIDADLTKNFNGSNYVTIPFIDLEKITNRLLNLAPLRRKKILEHVKKAYENEGWDVSHEDDREGSYWRFK